MVHVLILGGYRVYPFVLQAAVDSTIMDLEALKRSTTTDNRAVQQLRLQMATQRRKLSRSR